MRGRLSCCWWCDRDCVSKGGDGGGGGANGARCAGSFLIAQSVDRLVGRLPGLGRSFLAEMLMVVLYKGKDRGQEDE